jgi:hypothetical protein
MINGVKPCSYRKVLGETRGVSGIERFTANIV